jgi:YHS domain-containing protein
LIRFLIYAFMGYLGFKIVQKMASHLFSREIPGSRPKSEVEADELVQDPVCKVFVPRRNALKAHKNGEDFFFCSEGCRKKFLK